MADDAYGLIQVYGFRTSAYVSGASAGNAAGTYLAAAGGILTDMTLSAAGVSGFHNVVLMEAIAASATANIGIFIRAL
jgi:hypothetical protein